MDYSQFAPLSIEVSEGVATITMPGGKENHNEQHRLFGLIWRALDSDPDVKAVIVTGTGDEFYASGDPTGERMAYFADAKQEDFWSMSETLDKEVNAIVYEMINFSKPLVSAINGRTAGAGMCVALLADISIASDRAILWDPHMMLGIASGDGPLAIWPLLAGLAKTKLYVLTADALDGAEAERIGLVGRVVPHESLMDVALDYARRFVEGPPAALKFTKRALNQWFRLSGLVSYDYSYAAEVLTFFSGEITQAPWTEWPPRTVSGALERPDSKG